MQRARPSGTRPSRSARRAAAARGRRRAPVPAHVHLGHDRAGRRASLHVQGGFLVSIAREVAYQADAQPGDVHPLRHRHGLDHGPVDGGRRRRRSAATVVFAEGAPDWPRRPALAAGRGGARHDPRPLADAGPRADPARRRAGERHDLSSLRVLVTTGEPWNPEPYRWLFEHVGGGRCPIINCSGGTEVGACFLSPTPAAPIKPCSLGGPGARDGDGRRRRRGHARCAARSASSSAGGRSPG